MHSDAEKYADDKVYHEVKECADNSDIRGLRYIFLSCLDVDPTFKKYERSFEDYKDLSGLFVPHIDEGFMSFENDSNKWKSIDYWNQLKIDLLENFSMERFQHMREVAKVVYAEKILRLEKEQSKNEVNKLSIASQAMERVNRGFEQLPQGLEKSTKCEVVENLQNNRAEIIIPKPIVADTSLKKNEKYYRECYEAQREEEELTKRKILVKQALSSDKMYSVILRTKTQFFSLHRNKYKLKVTTFGDKAIGEELYTQICDTSEIEKNRNWRECIGEVEPDYCIKFWYDEMKQTKYYKVYLQKKVFCIGPYIQKYRSERYYYKILSSCEI